MKNPEMDSNATATPAPEEVGRVTEPGMESSLPSNRQKDPKKAAAGRAGAAARKAKQERFLEELRSAKEALRAPKDTSASLHEGVAVPSDETDTRAVPSTTGSMTPWIAGAGLVGLALWAASQRAKPTPPAPPTKSVTPTVRPVQHLKVDQFHME